MTVTVDPSVETFLRLIEARAIDDATGLAMHRLEAGESPGDIIRALLAPALAETGDRWHRAQWTVVHEHQATAVVDAALHRVVAEVQPRCYRATLAVLCAEGDWHTLPCRMAAELLRLDGWDVVFLGGSMPATDLARWLREAQPDAVVVTCSIPTFARGVVNIATVAAQMGIPVVAGGRGMGTDHRRAAALGVRWVAELAQLPSVLTTSAVLSEPDDLRTRLAAGEYLALRRQEVVDRAMVELGRRWPRLHAFNNWQLARTAEDLGHILDFASAAALTEDRRVFTDFVGWLTALLAARGVPETVVDVSLRALVAATPVEMSAAHTVLADATPTD